MSELKETIRRAILEGDIDAMPALVQQALAAGFGAEMLLKELLIPAMAEVGDLYETGEYFVPEMLIAAEAMKAGLGILRPLLIEGGSRAAGVVLIGTVKGDLHDIGKNLVALMLEGAGFEVRDMGVDVDPDRFIAALADDVDVLALSALLTTTMPAMESTLTAIEAAGMRARVRVIIGGAPVTQAYADSIGADGYAPDASAAVRLVKSLVS